MKYEASIKVCFKNETNAENALVAISHEGKESNRAAAKVERSGKILKITINAEDATAFRAFINSFLRDFQVLEGAASENSD